MVRPLRALTFAGLVLLASCGSPTRPQDLIPTLTSPAEGAVLSNGCIDHACLHAWTFQWSAVPGATRYHLYVIGQAALNPVIDAQPVSTSYTLQDNSYITDLFQQGWHWKVQAEVDGTYRDWSETRSFSVQPISSSSH